MSEAELLSFKLWAPLLIGHHPRELRILAMPTPHYAFLEAQGPRLLVLRLRLLHVFELHWLAGRRWCRGWSMRPPEGREGTKPTHRAARDRPFLTSGGLAVLRPGPGRAGALCKHRALRALLELLAAAVAP